MTPREQTAFQAGIAHAAEMARIAAVTIETRDDARAVRKQAAAAALHGLAEGLKAASSSLSKEVGATTDLRPHGSTNGQD